ncbi:Predicted glycosyl hydrolase, GH43/DUF377 family [Actinopolymorpha cephalotaxi]|uniref:GH43/DUF377 family glycosyl hydrolase n=1 Tax=Actinopolymorpha cephalotaxi TaxID=504797 RepID=A0A1I2LQX0_9ACTN|nr:glycoside hydrolase family 130 protein [Actinopolymorpha cephalotaxi]NYH81382.1 putative GH43/DUF377 family glycosyl hydrolase [Actinopolymorpha cephalotaxi]SFF80998.1 Predicted glycosyl hydrolase, GH43/DUF377 family [Actinopolymorpha cephalotaxi]
MTAPGLASRLDLVLAPESRRVIIRPFVPGEDDDLVRARISALVERVVHLDDDETGRLLQQTLLHFGGRHHDLEMTFLHHYDLVRPRIDRHAELSPTARLLVGAYCSQEYAVEAAALCNPSMVPHPDQSGLSAGQLRVALSLRQIGEGHLSSIGFATGVLDPGRGRLDVADRRGPLLAGRRAGTRHRRDLFASGLEEDGWTDKVSAAVLATLPEVFDDEDLDRALSHLPADLLADEEEAAAVDRLRWAASASYAVTFPEEVPLSQRVLWPLTATESNGMEDARFVRFVSDDGEAAYHATYTTYDGRHISVRMLSTADLRNFEVTPVRGPAARNKGMALFPRTVGGRHFALCRSDGETIGLSALDRQNRWQQPVPLHVPRLGWELTQVGNCGSPLETEAGWLVLTHGVGPMRRYAIGALLLDLHRPERVIAQLPGVLLAPQDEESEGYVPNVVYSCGGVLHAGTLWLPYGASDTRVGFATVDIATLLAAMGQ